MFGIFFPQTKNTLQTLHTIIFLLKSLLNSFLFPFLLLLVYAKPNLTVPYVGTDDHTSMYVCTYVHSYLTTAVGHLAAAAIAFSFCLVAAKICQLPFVHLHEADHNY